MTSPILGFSMLALIVFAIMMGFPTAFTLMGIGVVFGYIAYYDPALPFLDNRVFDLMVERAFSVLNNDTLISVPLFVLMGYVVERSALVDRMFHSVQLAFRRLPASLAVTTLVVCTFWGIASGIVGAVVVLMGVIALAPMLRAGYDVRLATGVIAAGGTLGILIPPSVMLIVYAAVAGLSVIKLYAAAIFPGLFLSLLYLAYILGWALLSPRVAPRLDPGLYVVPIPDWAKRLESEYTRYALPALLWATVLPARALRPASEPVRYGVILRNLSAALFPVILAVLVFGGVWWYVLVHHAAETGEMGSQRFQLWFWPCVAATLGLLALYYRSFGMEQLEILKMLLDSVIPLAILTALVLGSILFGLATATESAAVGVVGAFAIAWHAKRLSFRLIRESVHLSAVTSAMVCWLFIGSALFASIFALHGGQRVIEEWIIGLDMSPVQFLLVTQAIIFLLGWPLEWTEIIVIFVPIFLPMLKHFNIDPILFGMLVAVNLQAAFLSPPVAMSAFYLKGVAPRHVTLNEIFAGMMPYMLIVILCMAIMYAWPGMTLWLPNFLYGN